MRTESLALSSTLLNPEYDFSFRYNAVRTYLDSLAKPVGSLGTLEDYGARIAALQRLVTPAINNAICLIFAGDHGVAKDISDGGRNCSSYPQAVSRKVVEGLDRDIAGASILAKQNNVKLRVIDVGLADDPSCANLEWSGYNVRTSKYRIKGGTKNFCTGNAMTEREVEQCISVGRDETAKFIDEVKADIVLFGEVGIGNTTSASALLAALTGTEVKCLVGVGASTTRDGINDDVEKKKIAIIEEAFRYHKTTELFIGKPLLPLQKFGGAEIAALVGGMLECSDRDVPILVDGFMVTTAVLFACQIDPTVTRLLLFATQSTEKGQAIALMEIDEIARLNNIPALVTPALNMYLRMGEATGALLAIPLVRSACAIVSELATLNELLGIA
jgi:nicotinate-nucleotide--dimethylbenzimidazole phosphoribosyltransferase